MDIKLIITGDGRTAELPCGSVTLKSKRLAAAGTMEVFTPDKSVPLRCGMEARLSVEGTDVFAGYLFTVGAERGGRTLIAADSMRYLLCKDTKAYVNLSAAEIVRDICGERGLALGTAEDGGVKLEELTCDQQTLLDIISTAIDESEKMGGGRLTLFDDAGVLRLMREESFENADVVFITDGECALSKTYLKQLQPEQEARRFTITGILLDQGQDGMEFSLAEFCQNIYRTSELTGEEVVQAVIRSRV